MSRGKIRTGVARRLANALFYGSSRIRHANPEHLPSRITIDYRMHRSSGIGVNLRNIVHLLARNHRDRLQLTLLGGDPVAGTEHRPCRAPIYSSRELVEVPLRTPRDTDVFWAPNYNAPLASPGRLVVTVNDVCHLAHPEFFGNPIKAAYARFLFANVKRRADRVICISEFTAGEV